uniref:hypothetical protein n=1 Tax=Pedobacter schmidteae TaxID=2201271 RepID=UPI000EB213AC|nr:hypothetical protein [Pedobacter schmidteae]
MKNLFENYNMDEINSLLWDMYKGWFLHSVADLDSDKMVDMLLFYDEVKNLLKELPLPDPKNLE